MNQFPLTNEEKLQLEKLFQRSSANTLAHDVKYLVQLNPSFFNKQLHATEPTERFLGQYGLLIQRFLTDYHNRHYDVPWPVVAAFTTALLYMVNPFDLIPDTDVERGLADDRYMLQLALNAYGMELHAYVENMNIDLSTFDEIPPHWTQ